MTHTLNAGSYPSSWPRTDLDRDLLLEYDLDLDRDPRDLDPRDLDRDRDRLRDLDRESDRLRERELAMSKCNR